MTMAIPNDKPVIDPIATASYVAALSEELATLADRNGMPVVAHLLCMVQLEAKTIVRGAGRRLNPSR